MDAQRGTHRGGREGQPAAHNPEQPHSTNQRVVVFHRLRLTEHLAPDAAGRGVAVGSLRARACGEMCAQLWGCVAWGGGGGRCTLRLAVCRRGGGGRWAAMHRQIYSNSPSPSSPSFLLPPPPPSPPSPACSYLSVFIATAACSNTTCTAASCTTHSHSPGTSLHTLLPRFVTK